MTLPSLKTGTRRRKKVKLKAVRGDMVNSTRSKYSLILSIISDVHHIDPLTAQDVELRETCYGAMDRPDTEVNIVVNIILMIIIV